MANQMTEQQYQVKCDRFAHTIKMIAERMIEAAKEAEQGIQDPTYQEVVDQLWEAMGEIEYGLEQADKQLEAIVEAEASLGYKAVK